MADDIRYQRKCYYASPEYSASFWGKFIYLYQGHGGLRLTTDSLCLEACTQAVEIPFHAIKSIGIGRFSTWAKPFGLSYLTVSYSRDGEPRMIHLVPCRSVLDLTWVTSDLVASWHETLGNVEELTNRVQPAQFEPDTPRSVRIGVIVLAIVPALLVLIGSVIFWLRSRL